MLLGNKKQHKGFLTLSVISQDSVVVLTEQCPRVPNVAHNVLVANSQRSNGSAARLVFCQAGFGEELVIHRKQRSAQHLLHLCMTDLRPSAGSHEGHQ